MLILAIESSCDETSAAIVKDGTEVLSNITLSSEALFKHSGGVIPEQAARKQLEVITPVLHSCLKEADTTMEDIDVIAVTYGPGLLVSLLVGTMSARTLASIWNKPLIPVHHTLGHLSSTWLNGFGLGIRVRKKSNQEPNPNPNTEPQFPIITLSASGGHTDLWYRTAHTTGKLLGRTQDDAAGEAFDKGAQMLGLPYPGGPSISKAALDGDETAFDFPKPLKGDKSFNFSFSGLKTALKYTIRDLQTNIPVEDLSASYQCAINNHLIDRITKALEAHTDTKEIHIVGGVSANEQLREMMAETITSIPTRFPERKYCTDNAAMIGSAAYFLHQEKGDELIQAFQTQASLPLEEVVNV